MDPAAGIPAIMAGASPEVKSAMKEARVPHHREEEHTGWDSTTYRMTDDVEAGMRRAGYPERTIAVLRAVVSFDWAVGGRRKGLAWPKVEALVEKLQLARRQVIEHLDLLERGGLISREGDGGRGRPATTVIVWPAIMACTLADASPQMRVRNRAPKGAPNRAPMGVNRAPMGTETVRRFDENHAPRRTPTEAFKESENPNPQDSRDERDSQTQPPSAACDAEAPQPPAEVVTLVTPIGFERRPPRHPADEWFDDNAARFVGEQRQVGIYTRHVAVGRIEMDEVPAEYLTAVAVTLRQHGWGQEALGAVPLRRTSRGPGEGG